MIAELIVRSEGSRRGQMLTGRVVRDSKAAPPGGCAASSLRQVGTRVVIADKGV